MSGDRESERDWWLRTLLVLQAPRAVFAALRDDSAEAAADRSEPVLAIIFLAGIAGVLATRTAGRLMDDSDYDAILVAVWAFIAGSLYGATAYWLIGWLVHRGARALGSAGSYRRARHLVAFAAVPIALSLVLLPVKLALYGADIFRSGGADAGTGGQGLRGAAARVLRLGGGCSSWSACAPSTAGRGRGPARPSPLRRRCRLASSRRLRLAATG